MSRQMELFGPARLDAVPTNGTATSQAAAKRIQPAARGLALKIFEYIASRGAVGATDEEAMLACSISPNTIRGRRGRLAEIGWIRLSGQTRPTRSGEAANVWIACRDADGSEEM